MCPNNTAKSSKRKKLVLSSGILLVSTLLISSNLSQNHSVASAETQQLDPTLILLCETQTSVAPQDEYGTAEGDINTVSDIELMVSKPYQTPTNCLLPDARSPLFSSAYFRVPLEQEQNSLEQKTPDKQHITAKTSLVKAGISSVAENPDSQNKHLLSRLVGQIGSVKFARKPAEARTPEAGRAQKQGEPEKTVEVAPEPNEPALNAPLPVQEHQEQSARTLSPQTIEKIDQIISLAAKTQEPQLLAEMLHQAGFCEQAAYFYDLAATCDEQTQLTDADKAWLLTQKAICLNEHNPEQALQVYINVVSLYPDTPWTQLAQTRQSLIDWLNTQQPKKLVEQCRTDLKQTDDN